MGLFPVRAAAWGAKGHQIIARIATARLSTSARQAIASLLRPSETLESVSTWADQVRTEEKASWHFVPIPLKDSYYSPTKDCQRGKTCIIEAIGQQLVILRDTNYDSAKRAEALKFLIHLIGDLHQPFHVTTNTNPQDFSASKVKVKTLTGRPTNLHEVWDTDLVDYGRQSKSVSAYATLLSNRFQRSVSTQGSVTDWALEAHRLPWSAYYHTSGDFMVAASEREAWKLDQPYYDKNLPVVELQLVRAGARLAKVLNDVFNVKSAY